MRWLNRIKQWWISRSVVKASEVPVIHTMSTHFEIAKSQLGVKEIVGGKHNSKILQYHMAGGGYTSDEIAWCASFVNWCLNKAGVVGTRSSAARSFMDWGEEVDEPMVGDVVVFYRGSRSGWQGHVGFYAGEKGSKILVLGGNQNNRVCYQYYSKSKLLGYRRLKQ